MQIYIRVSHFNSEVNTVIRLFFVSFDHILLCLITYDIEIYSHGRYITTHVNKTLIKLQFVSFHSNCNEIKFLHSQYVNLCIAIIISVTVMF